MKTLLFAIFAFSFSAFLFSGCCDLRAIAGHPCGTTATGEEKAWWQPGTNDPAENLQ